jgi:hypothetical protein
MGVMDVRTGVDLWRGLTPELRAKGRTYAAVAFVGQEAPKLLPLKSGDVLVVNAGDRTLSSGGTSPQAIRDFVDRGVEVWSEPNLHAKVVATERGIAIVGSSNASRNSNKLHEAIAVTRDPAARRQLREFVKGLLEVAERVDEQFLRHAERVYRRPNGRVGDDSSPPGPFADPPKRLWIAEVEDFQPSPAQERRAVLELRALPVTPGWRYEPFFWDKDDKVLPRDAVIEVQRGWLSPPGRVMQLRDGSALSGGRTTAVGILAFDVKHKRQRISRLSLPAAIKTEWEEHEYVTITDQRVIRDVLQLW